MKIDDHLLKNSTVIKQEVIKTTIIKPRNGYTEVETEITARCAICNSIFFYRINKKTYDDPPIRPSEITYYIKDGHSNCQGIKATQIIETLMGLTEQKNCCEFCSWSRENYQKADDFYVSEIDFTCYKKIELAIEQNVAQLKGFDPNVSKVQICTFYSNTDVIKKINQEIMPVWKERMNKDK